MEFEKSIADDGFQRTQIMEDESGSGCARNSQAEEGTQEIHHHANMASYVSGDPIGADLGKKLPSRCLK